MEKEETLNELIILSQSSNLTTAQTTRKVGLNTSLMWKLLDISSSGLCNQTCDLFHPSLCTISAVGTIDGEDTTVENIEESEAILTNDTVESYAQPVDWFDAVTSPANPPNSGTAAPRSQHALHEQLGNQDVSRQDWEPANPAISAIPSETFIDMSEYQSMYLYEQGADMFEWWNCGTL